MRNTKQAFTVAEPLEITVRLEDRELMIDPSVAAIEPLQAVRWNFVDVPPHWAPGIVFSNNAGFSNGPFDSISLTQHSAIGRGNMGRAGHYNYTAVLRDWRVPRRSRFVSAQASIRQAPQVVHVEVDLAARRFRVDPQVCHIQPGEAVRWEFSGLEPGAKAEIRFREITEPRAPGPRSEMSYFGPFGSFTYSDNCVVGSGLGQVGKCAYDVFVEAIHRGPGGSTLRSAHSHDPVIDNEQDPPPEDTSR